MKRDALDSTRLDGLSEAEAARRLARDGANELPPAVRRSAVGVLLDVLSEPMFLLLVAAGFIYLVLGDLIEAVVLIAFATTSVLLTVLQEHRSEKVLAALGELSSPHALVIRAGERCRVPARELVRGDLVVVSEGERVPADGALIRADNLELDESLLTGESVSVHKHVAAELQASPSERPRRDDATAILSGTLVVRGQGVAEVTATGVASEIGKIGRSLARIEPEPPRLKQETGRLVRLFGTIGLGLSVLAVFLYGFSSGEWLRSTLAGIALGMSMLPEEFPLVLAVFTVMGAWRIAQSRVLTRRAAAIESLGETTVLCTDKTGTLTENRMALAELRTPTGERIDPGGLDGTEENGAFHALVAAGALASQPEPVDPMDVAFVKLADRLSLPGADARNSGTLERGYGLSPDLLAVTNVWRVATPATGRPVAAKGAPEAIASLCCMGAAAHGELRKTAEDMARNGLRVLGVARAEVPEGDMPDTPRGFNFEFLGLVGLADPVRANVPAAVRECREAGIRVVMITGDYPLTAHAIARAAGIESHAVLTGPEIEALDDTALAARVRDVAIFARIIPSEKLRIVEALKANGDVVAMIGDGVNDAPSLRAAHIGVAMGGRGTDVAREASTIVLLDDDFGALPQAIRLGRRIFDNLQKATAFIAAVHVPIAGVALLPLLFGLPILLEPLHIAFLELVIDPICAIAFENERDEPDIMKRPPRKPGSSLLPPDRIAWSLASGTATFLAVALVMWAGWYHGLPVDTLRSLTFLMLVLGLFALVLSHRSMDVSIVAWFTRPNPMIWNVFGAASAILAVLFFWPAATDLFDLGPLSTKWLALVAGLLVGLLLALDVMKRIAAYKLLDVRAAPAQSA